MSALAVDRSLPPFAAPEVARQAGAFGRHRARVHGRADGLADAAASVAPSCSRQTRRWLLAAAEACRRGSGPVAEPPSDVVEELAVRAPMLAGRLAVDAADRDALAVEEQLMRVVHGCTLAQQRMHSMHPPTFVLSSPAVITASRWSVPGADAFAIASRRGMERYVAWRMLADRLDLPASVHVGWRSAGRAGTGGPGQVFAADSPLAVEVLFDGLPPALDRLVITEAPA